MRCDLYIVKNDIAASLSDDEKKCLPRSYMEKAQEIAERSAGKLIVPAAAHACASAYLLHTVLGVGPEDPLPLGEHGKPLPVGEYRKTLPYALHYSISHDRDYTILAVARAELGVDIEQITDCKPGIVRRTFPKSYADTVLAGSGVSGYSARDRAGQAQLFTEYWTKLEAVLKAEGCGFAEDYLQKPELFEIWQVISFPWKDYMISSAMREVPELHLFEVTESGNVAESDI